MSLLLTEGVFQVEAVHGKLVRRDGHHVVGHPAGHPVVAADGLHPPDLVFVVEGDAVGLISAVLFEQRCKAQHTLACAVDVGQHQQDQVLLAYSSGNVLLAAGFGLPIDDQRVSREDAGVGGDGLRSGHADVRGIDAGGGPDPLLLADAGAGGVAHGVIRQFDLQVGEDGLVFARLLLRLHDDHLLDIVVAVIGACDHGRAVIAGVPADHDSGARHGYGNSFRFF